MIGSDRCAHRWLTRRSSPMDTCESTVLDTLVSSQGFEIRRRIFKRATDLENEKISLPPGVEVLGNHPVKVHSTLTARRILHWLFSKQIDQPKQRKNTKTEGKRCRTVKNKRMQSPARTEVKAMDSSQEIDAIFDETLKTSKPDKLLQQQKNIRTKQLRQKRPTPSAKRPNRMQSNDRSLGADESDGQKWLLERARPAVASWNGTGTTIISPKFVPLDENRRNLDRDRYRTKRRGGKPDSYDEEYDRGRLKKVKKRERRCVRENPFQAAFEQSIQSTNAAHRC